MGRRIAGVMARAGLPVVITDSQPEVLDDALADARSMAPAAHIIGETHLAAAVNDSDLVIEAIIENLAIKRETWAQLDQICPPAAIFASNTSSLSITELMIATSATRQTRFIGMHFFNPVPLMGLVEVIHTILTDEESIRVAIRAAEAMGKTVVQATDKTGFIVNRLLVPFILDGIRVLDEGLASITDIDNAVRLGCNHPMGPLTLADFVGLDTTLYIANIMFDEFKERRFAPPAILKRMVQAGLLGRKSGRGFYDYSDPRQPVPFAK